MRWLLQPYLRGLAPRWGARPSDAVFRWSFPLGPDDHRLPSTNPPGWPPAVSSAKNVPTPVPPEGGVPGAVPDAPKGVRIDSHPGGAAANRIRPFSEFGVTADNKAGRLRHSLFPICEYLRHLRLRNSDFGLLSGFGLRSSDFRAAEPDLPSTGRTLEQPCIRIEREGAGYCFGFGTAGGALVAFALRSCSSRLRPRRFLKTS